MACYDDPRNEKHLLTKYCKPKNKTDNTYSIPCKKIWDYEEDCVHFAALFLEKTAQNIQA